MSSNDSDIVREEQNQIIVMMKMSSYLMESYNYNGNLNISSRRKAIQLVKKYAIELDMTADERDTSVQIFDKYLMSISQNMPTLSTILEDQKILHIAVICSIMLSTKFHDCQMQLSMDDFSHCFEINDVIIFEEILLEAIGYTFFPQLTPSCFIHYLLNLCPRTQDMTKVKYLADFFVTILMEESEYCGIYAPSTIAIAAIMMSFEHFSIDLQSWLRLIPNECFSDNPSFLHFGESRCHLLLDISGCLDCIDKVSKKFRSERLSPRTVTENLEDSEYVR